MWLTDGRFIEVDKEAWSKMSDLSVLEKMRNLRESLRKWNKEEIGVLNRNIEVIEQEIRGVDEKTEKREVDECLLARGRALWIFVEMWYERKALYWQQLSCSRFAN
ncbi:hypothetical protein PIB30_052758 [Stylosanthes scabra]|uniref:Uncharacterized protein n=1 Tax=Stylosanthes scabra TaxID=79078 RepID=A0ABU6YIX7_9FABA|nr:hypothetical protein [Stylosanthes scabra]